MPHLKKITDSTDIFEQFKNLNVVIVGDVMIDRYWHGKVSRISPEAPVPVVELNRVEERLGGAANVALNIKALGATPYLFSAIGKDTEGVHFLRLMNEHNLNTRGIIQSNERATTVKTRIIGGSQQMLRVDSEQIDDLSDSLREDFLHKLRELLDTRDIHVIIFQDYNKGVLSLSVIREVMLDAIRRDIPTAVDPKKKHFLEYKRATLFKPNLKEIREALGIDIQPNIESLQRATSVLQQHLGQRLTMITLSEKGLFLAKNATQTDATIGDVLYPTQARSIADVSGAGDTVISVAALCLALGISERDMAMLSNLAGGQVCESVGVVPINVAQLRKEFAEIKGLD